MEWLKKFLKNFWSTFSASTVKEAPVPQAPAPKVEAPVTVPAPPKSEHPWFDEALLDAASGKWGEISGEKHNPLIVEALREAGLDPKYLKDETMWCGAYVNKKLKNAGITGLPSSPAWAASWTRFGDALPGFKRGAVACVPSKAANSGYHVTFADRLEGDKLYCLGGNQKNKVCSEAYPAKGVIYRWPKKVTAGSILTGKFSLPWTGAHSDADKWTEFVLREVEAQGLTALVPKDFKTYAPNYDKYSPQKRAEFWARVISIMCRYESNFRPETKFTESFKDSKGMNVISRGLLQLSFESANGYSGVNLTKPEDLHNATINLMTGIKILTRWVKADGVLFGKSSEGKWLGMGRYWSVGRASSSSNAKIITYLKSVSA